MSFRETPSRARREQPRKKAGGDERAYVLLEEARLRCELYGAEAQTDAERISIAQIHSELGMAGWLACSEMDPGRRLELLTVAYERSAKSMLHPATNHALAAVAISAEDVVAQELAENEQSDHLRRAHLHLLHAMELLAGHL